MLGKPPSQDSIGEINSLIDRLVNDIEGGIERRGREDGNLLYLIEGEAVRLKKELRQHAPSSAHGERTARSNHQTCHPQSSCLKRVILSLIPEIVRLYIWTKSSTKGLGEMWSNIVL